MEDNQLGKNLKHLRKIHGETLKDLADNIFLAQSTIVGYENGERKPDYQKLVAIAAHYGKTVDEILYTDLTGLKPININDKSLSDMNGLYKKLIPLFSSDEVMNNKNFRKAYHLCERVLEAFSKNEYLNGHIIVEILEGFLQAAEETEAPEAVANVMWSVFLWWSQSNDPKQMLSWQNRLMSKRIDMNHFMQEYQKSQKTPEINEKKKSFLQNFKEVINEMIRCLKSNVEWSELGDYYLALSFLLNMVDTELSSEMNKTIGMQMLLAYAELGNQYAIQFIRITFND